MDAETLADEFNEFFAAEGGRAKAEFIASFACADVLNAVRAGLQRESSQLSALLASKGVNHTVHADVFQSPLLDAVAATPRPGVSFVGISLGLLLRSKTLVEVLLAQAHAPDHPIVDADTMWGILRDDASLDDQWRTLRELERRGFVEGQVYAPSFPLIAWAFVVDYVCAHEMNHVLLGHTEYAARQLRLERLDEGDVREEADEQASLQLLELRADYGAGRFIGNRIPNKRFAILALPEAIALTVDELMANAAFAMTVILTGFNIAWSLDVTRKLFSPGSHPHPNFRFRIASEAVQASLRHADAGYAHSWYHDAAHVGNTHAKRAYQKILGNSVLFALQTGPVFYVRNENSLEPHPHLFSTDAETIYARQFDQVVDLDKTTNVIAYAE